MSLENSLNEPNKNLYDKLLAKGADIEFKVKEDATSWYMHEKRSFVVGAPNAEINNAAMAHELLHIDLEMKGFAGSLLVYKYFNEKNSSFTLSFINSLSNDLAHFKMLDDFHALGYNIDDFLQQTPKQYFLDGIFIRTTLLQARHKLGASKICEDILEIVKLVGGAKLFELYKIKDPSTVNGVHPDLVLDPLREIDKELVEGILQLFVDWHEANTVDNMQFFARLNIYLQEKGLPTAENCK